MRQVAREFGVVSVIEAVADVGFLEGPKEQALGLKSNYIRHFALQIMDCTTHMVRVQCLKMSRAVSLLAQDSP